AFSLLAPSRRSASYCRSSLTVGPWSFAMATHLHSWLLHHVLTGRRRPETASPAVGAVGCAAMRTHRLAIIGGDGVGPEVTAQALKALDAAEQRFGFATERVEHDLGGARYLATGEVLPDEELAALDEVDAILL